MTKHPHTSRVTIADVRAHLGPNVSEAMAERVLAFCQIVAQQAIKDAAALTPRKDRVS